MLANRKLKLAWSLQLQNVTLRKRCVATRKTAQLPGPPPEYGAELPPHTHSRTETREEPGKYICMRISPLCERVVVPREDTPAVAQRVLNTRGEYKSLLTASLLPHGWRRLRPGARCAFAKHGTRCDTQKIGNLA